MRFFGFALTGMLVWTLMSCTGQFDNVVQVDGKVPAACGAVVYAEINMQHPDEGVVDDNGITWKQTGDGFDIQPPAGMKVTGGVIYDLFSMTPTNTGFWVQNPVAGKTLHFTYAAFPSASSADLCVERT